jgi:vitamin B12 transporter
MEKKEVVSGQWVVVSEDECRRNEYGSTDGDGLKRLKTIVLAVVCWVCCVIAAAHTSVEAQQINSKKTAVAQQAGAQTQGTIRGEVADAEGAKIAGADVSVLSRNGLLQRATRTNSVGEFSFNTLETGDYIIEAKSDGFSTTRTATFRYERGKEIQLNIMLAAGSISENVLVTASGTPQTTDEVAKSVTTLDSAEIEARHNDTIAEALRGTPGLRVQQQGSPGSLVQLRFRGQRNYDTSVLLDGLRIRDASDINGSAAPFYGDFLPSDLDRIEIVRGSGSSIYGSNAIGGVINLVPKTGSGRPRFDAQFEGGGLGLFKERVGGSGGITSRGGYSFNVTRLDVRRGIDGHDEYGNTTAGGRLQFNLTPSISIAGNFLGSFANSRVNDSPFALPAAFTSAEQFPRAIEGQTFHSDFNNPDQGRRNNLAVASVRFSQALGDIASYTVAYQHVSARRRNYNGPAIDPAFASFYPFGDFAFVSINNGTTDTFDARANVQLGRHNLVTGGFEFERETLFQESIPSFSAFNRTTDRQRTYAVFGQDQISLRDGRFQASVAVRAQAYQIDGADRPGQLSALKTQKSIVGDGAVSYFFPSSGTKIRAHVGNGFRAPSLFERFGVGNFAGAGFVRFGDPTIQAEQSLSVDGGFDQRLAKDRVRVGATYFYTRLQRTVVFSSFSVDPLGLGRFSGYGNGPGGLSRGIETYTEVNPLKSMNVRASYTYTNSVRRVIGDGSLPEYVVPRHLVGLSVIERYRSFRFSGAVNYTGSYIAPVFENDFPFRTANLRFNGYTKVDAFGGYERAMTDTLRMTIFAGAENLLDEKYFENGFRAPGIVGRGGVKFAF